DGELLAFVYRRYLHFGAIEDLKAMEPPGDASLGAAGAARDVKVGRGGARGVEGLVERQALGHGGADAPLGRRGPRRAPAAAARARHGAVVQGAFAALFHGAEEERRREAEPELALLIDELDQTQLALWRLGQLGFRDLESAYRELRLLRDGPPHAPASARRRAALVRLAPALLTEIARSAAPERALHHLATFVSTIGARTSYLHLLLENPGVMRLLVRLFATSEFLSAFFLRHPEL